MFDLDREVLRWCRQVCPGLLFRHRHVSELVDHLHCEIARLMTESLSKEEAFRRATAEFGESKSLQAEYRKNWSWLSKICNKISFRVRKGALPPFPIRFGGYRTLATSLAMAFLVGTGFLLQATEVGQWARSTMIALYAIPFWFMGTSS